MTADKRAEAAEVEASGPTLVIENGWLCEAVNEHTCGTAAGGYYGAHEPGCGLVPIADIGDLLARRLAEARAEALLEAAREAEIRGDIGRPDQIEVWDWLRARAAAEQAQP